MNEFSGEDHDQAFKTWLAQHRNGFYLNSRTPGDITTSPDGAYLHRVGCHHLGDGAGVISTTYGKAASNSLEELVQWAEERGIEVSYCSSCGPG